MDGAAAGPDTVAVGEDGAVLGSAKMGPNRAGRGAHVATASFMVDPAPPGAAPAAPWARTRSRGRARRATARCSSTPSSRRTRAPCTSGTSLGFTIVGTVPEAFDHPTEATSACT